jgi:hypothetical protein
MKSVLSDSFHWSLPFGSLDFEASVAVKNLFVGVRRFSEPKESFAVTFFKYDEKKNCDITCNTLNEEAWTTTHFELEYRRALHCLLSREAVSEKSG